MNIEQLDSALRDSGIVFLAYDGFLTQSLIVGMTEALDKESENNEISLAVSTNILTVFIELSQNMMNYSKFKSTNEQHFDGKGLIIVGYSNEDERYYVMSRNLISALDKEKITPKLDEVMGMDKTELRKLYREKRKSGDDKHAKGAGIGFIEVARKCESMEYSFSQANNEQYYFLLKTVI